jgi:D-alanine-D-alanine ligase
VDLRVTPEGKPFVLEVNTIPGMTKTSDLPKAAAAAGIPFGDLVEQMLKTAGNRGHSSSLIERSWRTKAA